MPRHLCGGQRATCRHPFSPPAVRVQGANTDRDQSCLAASRLPGPCSSHVLSCITFAKPKTFTPDMHASSGPIPKRIWGQPKTSKHSGGRSHTASCGRPAEGGYECPPGCRLEATPITRNRPENRNTLCSREQARKPNTDLPLWRMFLEATFDFGLGTSPFSEGVVWSFTGPGGGAGSWIISMSSLLCWPRCCLAKSKPLTLGICS